MHAWANHGLAGREVGGFVAPLNVFVCGYPQIEQMVVLKTNQKFMEANRFKFPEAIQKLGLTFGQAVVMEHDEDQEARPAATEVELKKRARSEKLQGGLKQAFLEFTAHAASAKKAATGQSPAKATGSWIQSGKSPAKATGKSPAKSPFKRPVQ